MDKTNNLFLKDLNGIPHLLATTAIAAVSGFVTFFSELHTIWMQVTYLLHTLVGFYLAFIVFPYIGFHFKRTLPIRRPLQIIVGLLALSALLALIATGLHIGIFGQYESKRWIFDWHVYSSYIAVALMIAHPLLHHIFLPAKRRDSGNGLPGITSQSLKRIVRSLVFASLTVTTLSIAYASYDTGYNDIAVSQPYSMPFGPKPFRPSEAQTVTGSFLDPRRIGRSDKCAECHEQISKEWRASIHSLSATDPAFQTNVHALAGKKGIATTRYCLGCHGPVALLSGQASDGGSLSKGSSISEGVSCMACHGIEKAVHLKGVGSYLYKPQIDYLFGDRDDPISTEIHNYLINIAPRQHRRDMARDILSSPKHCATCHVQYIDKEINDWGWIKLQDQYGAWLNGPYSGQSEQTYSRKTPMRCQDCHFPLIKSDDPSADQNGLIRSHRTPAANTAIPTILGDLEQLEVVTKFLQDNRIKININTPEFTRTQSDVSNKTSHANQPNSISFSVAVTNFLIGHRFPAGTFDLNEPWLAIEVIDANNKTVFTSGHIDANNEVDPNAHFYRSIPVNRKGERVWRHDLFNVVGSGYENLIPPGKSDIVKYSFFLPDWAQEPLTVKARLRYRKFNTRYAKWSLKNKYKKLPIVDMATDEITVSMRKISLIK